jgi:glycosyltransferase involved in cell wall biosynthesis
MTTRPELPIVVDARLTPGEPGGVQQVVIGLAAGLSRLEDGPERFYFVVRDDDAWLRPFVSGPSSIVRVEGDRRTPLRRELARRLPGLARVWGRGKRAVTGLPGSDGTAEGLGARVVHFPTQNAYLTGIPSIYHPHDLQHVHYPEFFSEEVVAARELTYRTFCEQASMVSVTTQWGKRDLVEHFGLPPDRVVVTPLAPAIATYDSPTPEESKAAFASLGVTEPYAYYPAQTWPHKNHIRLVEAIADARDRLEVQVSVVCSGLMNEHYPAIQERARELGVDGLIHFVGFVEPVAVRVLYENARMLVFPTLFEAAGGFGPLFEAFEAGVPVATSSATSLKEQAGDAALFFDPTDVREMADRIVRLWQDDALRAQLAERGRRRVSRFTWDRVARTFRAHYRRIAGRPLTDEDRVLIDAETPF